MADYQVSSKKPKWFHSPIVLLVLIGVCIFFASNMITLVKKNRDTRQLKEQASRELTELQVRKQKLEEDITSLKSERGQEEVIRENFQVTKDGEGVVVIIDNEKDSEEVEKKPENFFQRIIPKGDDLEF
ncbi:MAG: hypothetical protein QG669_195 [Patescibacteria group bacterium]|nr:hypothetical protein [Patescibacteria group bacterium]